jgi:hypothetical protein
MQLVSRLFYVSRPYIAKIKNTACKLQLREYLWSSRKVTLSAGLASALAASVVWCYTSAHGKMIQYGYKLTKHIMGLLK